MSLVAILKQELQRTEQAERLLSDRKAKKRAEQSERAVIYAEKTEAAAKIEQAGNYAQAADLWLLASKCASNSQQEKWCQHRATYCKRWQNKREG